MRKSVRKGEDEQKRSKTKNTRQSEHNSEKKEIDRNKNQERKQQ